MYEAQFMLTSNQADWNPVTLEQAVADPTTGYVASKAFAVSYWSITDAGKDRLLTTNIGESRLEILGRGETRL